MGQWTKEEKLLSAKLIANYFIWKSSKEHKPITNKKLQKLLYYAQAWHLALKDKPLFREDIEAWVHGPTVRDVYFTYKDSGFGPIDKKIEESIQNKLNNEERFLNEIWRVYGKFDADYLEVLTHNEEPWQKAREGLEGHIASDNVISHDLMKYYYLRRLKETKKH